jgi:histone H3/H4
MQEPEKTPAYINSALETMQLLLNLTVTQLPERAMQAIVHEGRFHSRWLAEEAKRRDNDPARDRAAAAYEIVEALSEAVDQKLEELADGASVRTVQPYPVEP